MPIFYTLAPQFSFYTFLYLHIKLVFRDCVPHKLTGLGRKRMRVSY
jgi:hypothetical protein